MEPIDEYINNDTMMTLSNSGNLETKSGKTVLSDVSIESSQPERDIFRFQIPINMKLETIILHANNITSLEAYDTDTIDTTSYTSPSTNPQLIDSSNTNFIINEGENVVINLIEKQYVNGLVLKSPQGFMNPIYNIYLSDNGINFRSIGVFETTDIPINKKTKFIKIEPTRCFAVHAI